MLCLELEVERSRESLMRLEQPDPDLGLDVGEALVVAVDVEEEAMIARARIPPVVPSSPAAGNDV